MKDTDKKGRNMNMIIPTVVMGILALVLSVIAYNRGQHIEGARSAVNMILEILPLLIFALIVAGMIKVVLPHEVLSKWIGSESGLKGIFIGTISGAVALGGPYVSLPFAAGLLRSGAGIGTVVAFLTAWSLWGFGRLPMEVGILGWKFTLIRFASVFFFPPIAGLIARAISKIFT